MRVPTSVLNVVQGTVIAAALATGCSVGPTEKADEPCATPLLAKIHYLAPTPPPLPPPHVYDEPPPPCGRG